METSMIGCGICGGELKPGQLDCPKCGAKLKRDLRGLLSGPFFFAAAVGILQESVLWSVLIGCGGIYALSTLRNFRWVPGKPAANKKMRKTI
ncbi:transposase [Leisingera caerulea]|uniref:transposase n=1 Tax=Leisingera caerulea TaxID=506591 RepID=UPI000485754D|nr:transposase [Leisingera caerulea]